MKLSQFKNTSERREFLEKELKINLQYIKKAHIEDEKNINCENLIGETTLPLGVAGPIKIKNLKLNPASRERRGKVQSYYIPLATTEGALVASVNRGCKVINQSGGANVFVNKIGTTRGPVYELENLEHAFWFLNWLKKNEKKIKKQAEKTSAHLKYLKFETKILGVYVYVRFYFDCQEAMGMNMVTIAVDAINQLIEKETGIKCLSISGNFCIDKKPAWLDFFLGRGREVWAEVVLKEKVVKEILKTETQKLFEVWLTKIQLGSMVSGSLGFNGHFANIVAAFFAATGQDLAHVVEGSLGITTTKLLPNGDLYFSIYMPSVMIGKVGGGTKMEIKKEAIAIIGAKDSNQLAQILGAAVLAGEISLLSSLAEGSLVKAHTSLGRR